jgi:hypothetical protein
MRTDDTTPAKDPQDWATGDEPATAPQISYLQTLSRDTGRDLPDNLSKAQASRLIDELQQTSPRTNSQETSGE